MPTERLLSPDGELGFRVARLARALRRRWAAELAPLGLSPPQAVILRTVAAEPALAVRALARTLGSDPMNVKRCVDDLEARGLIRSAARPGDRRPRALHLTAQGDRLAVAVARLARAQESWLAGALPPDQRRCLSEGLGHLENLVAGEGPPAGVAPEHDGPPAGSPPARDGPPVGVAPQHDGPPAGSSLARDGQPAGSPPARDGPAAGDVPPSR